MKYILCILLLISNAKSFCQITNNGAAITILSGTTINADSLDNVSGIITNSGNLTLKNSYTNLATATGSGSYNIGGNWLSTGTFTAASSIVTFNGAGAQNISSANNFNNISINKSAGNAVLLTDITATGTVNFTAGNIQTDGNKLIISPSGNITGSSQSAGWVFGNLQKNIAAGSTTTIFETGSSAEYNPSSITFNGVSMSGNIIGYVIASDHPNLKTSNIDTNRSVNRYFTFTNNGIIFTDASLTFNWVAADVDGGANTANFKVGKYNGSSWSYPVVASPNPTSIQITGVTSFSDFAIGESLVVLPVKLSNLRAFQKNEGIQVEWITQFESNMVRYEVERSTNGQQFLKIGSVQAKGNSSQVLNYNLFDANPISGINYYRIRSVGIGADISYSQIVKVNLTTGKSEIIFYPNPVIDNLIKLKLSNVQKGNYSVSLTNTLGQQVFNKILQHNGGTSIHDLPVNNLIKGIYQLQIMGNGTKITKQVLKN